ncbi:MAG: head-tail connector protein [Veillonella caviae]|nr:head-tail connector protein [Veillonella caviae]
MDLTDVKLYLRIDSDEEDELLESLIKTAVAYIRQAVDDYDVKIIQSEDFRLLAEQCQRILVVEMYENRNAYGQKHLDYSYTIRSMISQLQFWGGDADV